MCAYSSSQELIMVRYTRKRAMVEAARWFKPGDCPAWARQNVTEEPGCFYVHNPGEAPLRGDPGDWIVCGEDTIYPLKNHAFRNAYELYSERAKSE